VVVLGLVALPALAQQQEPEQHHPPAASPTATAAPSGGTSGRSMPGMGGVPMMGMMRMMMGPGRQGQYADDGGHVEGRLAFLKTELKITDAQLPLWNAVADAIRANAKSMGEMSGEMMGSSQTSTLPDKLAMRGKNDDGASRRAAFIQGRHWAAVRGAERRTEENRRRTAHGTDGNDEAEQGK
jgi:hypothetical protein